MHTGHTFWSAASARSRPPPPRSTANTVYATVLDSGHGSATGESSRSTTPPARSAGRAPAQPQRVLAAGRPRHALLRLPERHRLRANARNGNVVWTYHAAGAVKASPTLVRRNPLLRRLLRPRPGDLRAHRPADLAQRLRRRAARQRHLLLDRRGRSTAASSSATPTGASTPTTPPPAARLGGADRRLRLRLPRRHQRARPRPDRLRRLLQRHLLRAQRPLRAHQLAASTRTGASPARPRSSGASSTSPTSATHRTYGLGISTGRVALRDAHRLLRPRDQRRQQHLPDRLHRPLRARTR